MKFRPLVLAVALIGFVGLASAQETFFAPDTDGCQTYMPFVWTDLAPGARWQATVDMSKCTSADFGWYRYYGYIASTNSADFLSSKDGIVLTAQDLSTGQVLTGSFSRVMGEYIMTMVDRPTQYLLRAENTSRKTCKVRLTWTSTK